MDMDLDRVNGYKGKSLRSFNRLAKHYDSSYIGRQAHGGYGSVLDRLSTFPYRAVLDVGCGTGAVLSMIPRRPGVRLCGVDLAPEMIEVAQARLGSDVELKVGDSEHLPWPDSSFDCVICTFSFHHYPQPEKVLSEMYRVLRDGGHVIIADPWAPAPARQIVNLILRFGLGADGDVRVYDRQDLVTLMDQAGFIGVLWQALGVSTWIASATVDRQAA